MTILRDIRAAELAQQSHREVQKKLDTMKAEALATVEAERDKLNVDLENKIVLDLKKDPDPYGYFGISLIDRLMAMGWPIEYGGV